jgi:hypothetical protein
LARKLGSSNGPDWTDVAVTMQALGEFHNATVTLTMSQDGARSVGDLRLTATAKQKGLTFGAATGLVSRSLWWPSTEHREFVSAAYGLLLRLDLDCGQMWMQTELFPKR